MTGVVKRSVRWLARVVVAAAVIAGVVWMVGGLDRDALVRTLSHARLWPIVVAAVINFLLIACKAIAWRVLLGPAFPVPIARLFSYAVTSCAASVVLPLRGGELVRLWLLRDRDGVPLAQSAAVALSEKLLDAASMVLLAAPLPLFVDELPPGIGRPVAVIAAAVVVALVAIALLAPRFSRHRFFAALSALRSPSVVIRAVAILFASWLVDLAMVCLVAWAIGMHLTLGAGIVVLFAINAAIAVPSTPGQFGALEIGAVMGCRLLGFSDEAAFSFALLYHALQIIPVTAVGLALNARAVVSMRA